MGRRIYSIDIETTGLDPERCQVLEVGVVALDLDTLQQDWWSTLVSHETIVGEPIALAMNAHLIAQIGQAQRSGAVGLKEGILEPNDVIYELRQWIARVEGKEMAPKITVVGKNVASFDLPFLRRLPGGHGLQVRHRVIDPGSMFFDPRRDSEPPDLAECCRRAGLADQEVKHRALPDAQMAIDLLLRKWGLRS